MLRYLLSGLGAVAFALICTKKADAVCWLPVVVYDEDFYYKGCDCRPTDTECGMRECNPGQICTSTNPWGCCPIWASIDPGQPRESQPVVFAAMLPEQWRAVESEYQSKAGPTDGDRILSSYPWT